MPADFAALERGRLARDPRDLTAAASTPPRSAPFAYKGFVVHRRRERLTSSDGLRFEYAGTPSGNRSGFAGMTPERRREVSAKANAARSAKVSAKRRSQIASRAGYASNLRRKGVS